MQLWTLLALNAIELSWRLTLNTVYTESYWHINSTELTLHWKLHNKEQTALNATHNLVYPYHKTFKITPWHSTPHCNFTPPFHTIRSSSPHHSAPLHTVVHPGHRHSTSYNIPFHITPCNKYISSVVFNSAHKTHLFPPSGLWLLCLCACAIGFVRVCVPATFHITSAAVFM